MKVDSKFDTSSLCTDEFFKKITTKTPVNELNSYMSRDISSASKVLNIYRNKQNSKYIKAAFSSILDVNEREKI